MYWVKHDRQSIILNTRYTCIHCLLNFDLNHGRVCSALGRFSDVYIHIYIYYLQSGSALADWALIEDKFRVQNTSLVLGRLLGCPIDSSWKLVNCLRMGRSFYELGNAEFQVLSTSTK